MQSVGAEEVCTLMWSTILLASTRERNNLSQNKEQKSPTCQQEKYQNEEERCLIVPISKILGVPNREQYPSRTTLKGGKNIKKNGYFQVMLRP